LSAKPVWFFQHTRAPEKIAHTSRTRRAQQPCAMRHTFSKGTKRPLRRTKRNKENRREFFNLKTAACKPIEMKNAPPQNSLIFLVGVELFAPQISQVHSVFTADSRAAGPPKTGPPSAFFAMPNSSWATPAKGKRQTIHPKRSPVLAPSTLWLLAGFWRHSWPSSWSTYLY